MCVHVYLLFISFWNRIYPTYWVSDKPTAAEQNEYKHKHPRRPGSENGVTRLIGWLNPQDHRNHQRKQLPMYKNGHEGDEKPRSVVVRGRLVSNDYVSGTHRA